MLPILVLALLGASPVQPAHLQQEAPELSQNVLDLALKAYARAKQAGVARKDVLAIIDYSLPSSERRLWIFDLAHESLLFHELVAHGRGSGDDRATKFSNRPQSLASSLGLFATGGTYQGKHGLSLKLQGLEPGVNDQAGPRAIVVHGADYVTDAFVRIHGRLGRSWGCPAVDASKAPEIIDVLRDGAVVFAYYPDDAWLRSSRFLH